MRVVADVRELLAVVAGPTSRPNGEAVLIRDDGTLVSSQKAGGERIPFFAADLLRERLKGYQPGDPQFRVDFTARDKSGRSFLVGVAPSQLVASFPHLTWLVAVTQAEDDLLSPVRAQLWRLLAPSASSPGSSWRSPSGSRCVSRLRRSSLTCTSPNIRRCPASKKTSRRDGVIALVTAAATGRAHAVTTPSVWSTGEPHAPSPSRRCGRIPSGNRSRGKSRGLLCRVFRIPDPAAPSGRFCPARLFRPAARHDSANVGGRGAP